MKEIICHPIFWLGASFLVALMGLLDEGLPCMKKFRAEQEKHPRFTNVPGYKVAKCVIAIWWLSAFASIIGLVISTLYFPC